MANNCLKKLFDQLNKYGIENQNGPYTVQVWDSPNAGLCSDMTTDKFYGEIPSSMTFKEFLMAFSSTVNGKISLNSPPWTSKFSEFRFESLISILELRKYSQFTWLRLTNFEISTKIYFF